LPVGDADLESIGTAGDLPVVQRHCGVFVTMFVRGIMRRTPEWSLVMFIGPFGAAGAALVYFFVRQVMVVTGRAL